MNDLNQRFVPSSQDLPRAMVRAEPDDQQGMVTFVDWCLANENLIAHGRKMGFRLGVSPAVRDLILLSCTSEPEKAKRILANLQNVEC